MRREPSPHGDASLALPEGALRQEPRPLSEQVVYELHIGTFTEQGTYVAAASRLAELAELG